MADVHRIADVHRGYVLIIEDDEGVAHLEQTRLQRYGHTAVVAPSTETALRILDEDNRFDLLVLDYTLKGDITGLDLFAILRERGINIPAVLVTGFEDPDIIVRAMRIGIRDFLPKTNDYLNDLPLAVERVLRLVSLERQAAESVVIKEKQQLLEAAFDAARLASFVWDKETLDFRMTGYFSELIGESRVQHLKSWDDFIALLHVSDRQPFRDALSEACEHKTTFESQFRIIRDDGALRWVFVKGRYQYNREGSPIKLACVLNDITARRETELALLQSNEKIKALNERLQFGMVETNHRVKNHLQNVISLLNYQLRNKDGTLHEADIQSIVAHIHGLASLHDVLADEVREDGDGLSVEASEVLGRVADVVGSAAYGRLVRKEFGKCRVTARQASSLSVILNELLSNALKHGSGTVEVEFGCRDGNALLTVANTGSRFPEKLDVDRTGRAGLVLVKILSRSDLDAEPQFLNTPDGKAKAVLKFSISSNLQKDSVADSQPSI